MYTMYTAQTWPTGGGYEMGNFFLIYFDQDWAVYMGGV